ncbi:hypothetical protein AJ80_03816 [Polytolypa hystricis UAMH7299]|uniref:Fungal N-terminal domain-containing protein n=1 Tax=Polytolypa hystricis (strain UAMH7299) TaxID=1447883 RepID=A0A2B7YF32_POLH7|nr:hypothetical protein AJ80_03816 [Polytolypa hystricis UAMH7299]
MAAAFGFSVGDLIAGLRLLMASFEAVRGTYSSQTDYLALRSEIDSLLLALESIDDLDLERRGSERQWSGVAKRNYVVEERKADGSRGRSWRDSSSINMLLITFQAKDSMRTATKGQEVSLAMQVTTVTSISSESSANCENTTTLLELEGLTCEQRQFFQLLIRQNEQLNQSLEDIRKLLQVQTIVPAQVMLQQPVVLLDAFGKTSPVSSGAGVPDEGLVKLDKKEFHIQETSRRRDIDIARPWCSVFRPGQHVDMMHSDACGLWYHVSEEPQPPPPPYTARPNGTVHSRQTSKLNSSLKATSQAANFSGFRRVRIIATLLFPQQSKQSNQTPIDHANESLKYDQRGIPTREEIVQSHRSHPALSIVDVRICSPPFQVLKFQSRSWILN